MSVLKQPFQSDEVAAVFADYPEEVREKVLRLRDLIFEAAKNTEGVGELTETLKWGQPSYLTEQTGSGTTIRIDKDKDGGFAIYAHCQTHVIDDFKKKYGDKFSIEKNRAVHFKADDKIPEREVSELIESALTYHQD